MNAKASKRLRVGDKVMWAHDREDVGEVVSVGHRAVAILWERTGNTGVHVHHGMKQVTLLRKAWESDAPFQLR